MVARILMRSDEDTPHRPSSSTRRVGVRSHSGKGGNRFAHTVPTQGIFRGEQIRAKCLIYLVTRATPIVRLALRGILLTAQRPSEVAGMMVSELHNLDQSNPHWIITRLRTKNKKAEHMVPLSPAAVLLINEGLKASKEGWEGKNDRPVFAGRFNGVKNLARHSLSHAIRRILKDEKYKEKFAKFTPHDLRRTAATFAQSMRVPREYVKALLNHRDEDVTATYARWHMVPEKREAVMAIEAAVLQLMPAPAGLPASA